MDIGEKIRRKGIRRLAAEVGVDPSHISLVCSGKRGASVRVVVAIAAALKLDVSDLLRHLESQRRKSGSQEISVERNPEPEPELEPELA